MSDAAAGPPVVPRNTPPYPGLRSFSQKEAKLFFGRDDEIDAMVDRFFEHRFLAVLGASGSGKSSLVRAGLQPVLQSGTTIYGSNWLVADMSPGGEPMAELAKALLTARAGHPDFEATRVEQGLGIEPTDEERLMLQAQLGWGPRAIAEWADSGGVPTGWRLLVLVDQFEELFNYKSLAGREDAQAFAALLPGAVGRLDGPTGAETEDEEGFEPDMLEVPGAADQRVFVVLTMRSDYFGFCSAHPELAQAIGDSCFLTPRVLRDQCHEAIVGPARLLGFRVGNDLITRLLNDMEVIAPFVAGKASGSDATDRQADQLPLMQFVLNRMWQHVTEERGAEDVVLTLDDYEAVGGLEGALGKAGDRAIDDGKLDIGVVERVFRALVHGPSVERAVRDPRTVAEIGTVTGLPQDQIIAVVKAFSAPDIQFLRLKRLPLGAQTIVDITHEAIIRQWSLLKDWVRVEAHWADSWRRLAESAVDWLDPDLRRQDNPERARSEALIDGLVLERRREWLATAAPTPRWTERYPVFRRDRESLVTLGEAEEFVETSAANELARIRKARRAQVRRRLATTAGFAAAILVALGSLFWILNYQRQVEREIAASKVASERQRRANDAAAKADAQARLAQVARAEQRAARALERAARTSIEASLNKRKAEVAAGQALAATRTAERDRTSASLLLREAAMLSTNQQVNLERSFKGVTADQVRESELVAQQIDMLRRVQSLPPLSAEADRQFTDLIRRALWLRAEALFQSVGSSSAIGRERKTSPRMVAAVLDQIAEDEAKLGTQLDLVSADFVRARAAELRGEFDQAATAYGRTWAASKPGGSAPNAALAYRSAAALVALHPFIELKASAAAAEWCTQPPSSSLDPDGKLASQGCRLDVVNMYTDKDRSEQAEEVLDALKSELVSEPAATSALSFEQARVRIGVQVAGARLGGIGDDVDEEFVSLARLRLSANPDAEAAADLLAGVLDANEDGDALATRRTALDWSESSTGFLLRTAPMIEKIMESDTNSANSSLTDLDLDNALTSERSDYAAEGEDADAAVASADQTMLAWRLYDTLHGRGAPLPVGNEPRPIQSWLRRRDDLTVSIRYRFRTAAGAIMRDAQVDDVLADAASSPLTYLSEGDRSQLQIARNRQMSLAAACNGPGADHCSAIIAGLTRDMTVTATFAMANSRAANQQSRKRAVVNTDAEPWLLGHDVVTYQSEDGPRRGRTDIAYRYGGETLLFANETNRELFKSAPGRYLPAHGGAAPEWLRLSSMKAGSARIFCRAAGGRPLTLFTTVEDRDKICGDEGTTNEGRTLLASANAVWKARGAPEDVLARQSLIPREPASSEGAEDRLEGRMYRITGQTPVVPIAGRAELSSAGPLIITHPDQSKSTFYLGVGDGWDLPEPRDLKAGEPLPVKPGQDSSIMLWTFEAASPSGFGKYVPIADVLRGR